MKVTKPQAFLDSLIPQAFHMELGPMRDACRLWDHPETAFPSIHISGTNGKGSTAAFLSTMLQGSGYRVGLYTSPHLVEITERMQIDRRPMSAADLARLVAEIRTTLPDERGLSYFEFLTLLAFLYFRERKIDIAVIETGMGGRLDATNVITSKVQVITSISFDHVRHLGFSLPKIAEEKCGIIKRGVPTVTAVQEPAVARIVQRVCDDVGSPLCVALPDDITTPLGLSGDHQRQNAACAVEAAQLLAHAGFTITRVTESLAQTRWAGRLEEIHQRPRVLLDAAHNSAGSETLAAYLDQHYPRERTTLLIGAFADKDIAGIVRPLVPMVREVVCVEAPSVRAASPKDLAAAARSFGAKVTIDEQPEAAIDRLMKTLKANECLVIAGSVSVVGVAKKYFSEKKK